MEVKKKLTIQIREKSMGKLWGKFGKIGGKLRGKIKGKSMEKFGKIEGKIRGNMGKLTGQTKR